MALSGSRTILISFLSALKKLQKKEAAEKKLAEKKAKQPAAPEKKTKDAAAAAAAAAEEELDPTVRVPRHWSSPSKRSY